MGCYEVVNFLTNYSGLCIEAKTNNQDKPLHLACTSRNLDTVRHLLFDKHCDINAKGFNGYTPLHAACETNNLKL